MSAVRSPHLTSYHCPVYVYLPHRPRPSLIINSFAIHPARHSPRHSPLAPRPQFAARISILITPEFSTARGGTVNAAMSSLEPNVYMYAVHVRTAGISQK
ncbi:hypothetical protein DFH09DRAFT_1317668 [Mycena vulgaris]|nr:hypothetical protein DFH09DRAFT_1317668 [Mycena vulgaris]